MMMDGSGLEGSGFKGQYGEEVEMAQVRARNITK